MNAKLALALATGPLLLTLCSTAGQAGDGVVALQTADTSCGDDSGNIYVDCGNGTVTDNRTGLVWLENADCIGEVDWYTAMEFVAGLSDIPATSVLAVHDCGLSDGSSPGEWWLPSAAELEAMVADAVSLGCTSPTITNDQGSDCWDQTCQTLGVCSFSGVQSSFYWSSSSTLPSSVVSPTKAWGVSMSGFSTSNGRSTNVNKADTNHIWPVRGGQ